MSKITRDAPHSHYPLRLLYGVGQIEWKEALSTSLSRAATDRLRIYIGLAWTFACGIIFSVLNDSWLYGISSTLLVGSYITFLSVVPWRIRLYRRRPRSILYVVLANGTLALVVGTVLFWLSTLIPASLIFGRETVDWMVKHPIAISVWGLFYPFVGFGIAIGEDQAEREKEQAKRAERLKELFEESRLVALRAQINPHFFFNALNTIAALIPTRPKDAERAVELLAQALRPALTEDQPMLATIESELAIAQAYTEIEKLRLGDRVTIEFQISEKSLETKIPSLSLQPLIENAIRHGAAKTGEPFRIKVSTDQTDERMLLEIHSGPEPSFEQMSPTEMEKVPMVEGHSIHNIRTRLSTLMGPSTVLDVRLGGNLVSHVRLLIPTSQNATEEGK